MVSLCIETDIVEK